MGKTYRGPDRDKFDKEKYKRDRKNRQGKRSIGDAAPEKDPEDRDNRDKYYK